MVQKDTAYSGVSHQDNRTVPERVADSIGVIERYIRNEWPEDEVRFEMNPPGTDFVLEVSVRPMDRVGIERAKRDLGVE